MDSSSGDFLTVHVYGDTEGKRIYYPGNPMFRGLYTNNPHTLVRYVAFPSSSAICCPFCAIVYPILSCVLVSFDRCGYDVCPPSYPTWKYRASSCPIFSSGIAAGMRYYCTPVLLPCRLSVLAAAAWDCNASEALEGVLKCVGGWVVRPEASHCLFN